MRVKFSLAFVKEVEYSLLKSTEFDPWWSVETAARPVEASAGLAALRRRLLCEGDGGHGAKYLAFADSTAVFPLILPIALVEVDAACGICESRRLLASFPAGRCR